jgi:long-chain acyl-CoA synthetase
MYEHSPLLKAVMLNTEKYSDKIAIVINGNAVTYGDLGKNIRKASGVLKSMGMHAGDRIILSAHKDVEYVYLYLGAHILGVTNVIIDAESNEERLQYIESKVNPVCCFGYQSSQFPSKQFDELGFGEADEVISSPANLKESDIAEILFTTGTTGAPKGVCLSYYNIYSSASNINKYIGNQADDIELLGLPICHSFGMGRIRCNLIKGATIVILSNFANVRAFLKAIEQFGVTGFGVVPAAWAYIRKMSGTRIAKYADQIHYIEIGSAAMSLDTKREMLSMFPNARICMHYGLTEASRICFQEFHDMDHLDSIGKPVCDKVDVKIFNEKGCEVAQGEKGELCVKGNMVLTRYLEENDTKNAFFGDYFRTGDCGYKNVDGYIYLLGREKELINVGGKKVSPMEVEDAIMALGVGDCVCVPMKDDEGIMGELVFCYILKDSASMTFEEISAKLSDKLEVYKRPVAYEWIDKIPMTASGKKQRLQVKK